jgi:hypothetical protein
MGVVIDKLAKMSDEELKELIADGYRTPAYVLALREADAGLTALRAENDALREILRDARECLHDSLEYLYSDLAERLLLRIDTVLPYGGSEP